MLKNLLTSTGGWVGIIAAIVVFGNQLIPVVPTVWGNLIAAILGVIALYYHGDAVSAGRSAGASIK